MKSLHDMADDCAEQISLSLWDDHFVRLKADQVECVRDVIAHFVASRDRDIIERCAALVDRDAQANWDRSEPAGFRGDDAAETHEAVAMALEGLAKDIRRALSPAGTAPACETCGGKGKVDIGATLHDNETTCPDCSPVGTAVPEVCGTCDGQGGWFYKTKQSMVPCGDCNGTGRR